MADNTHIEWTDALFGKPLPRRCSKCRVIKDADEYQIDRSRRDGLSFVCRDCRYVRITANGPGKSERQSRRERGEKWCRHCAVWLPAEAVGKNGLCRSGENEYAAHRYATDNDFRRARVQHSVSRKRGIDPVPLCGMDALTEEFEGRCAYCEAPASTWDHIKPVSRGGMTVPSNIVPCCRRCNSSKRDQEVFGWLAKTGRIPHDRFYDRLDLEDIHGR